MKKLSFIFAMVLAGSMAMAQAGKTTWITQSGNGNLADVKQTAGLDNYGYAANLEPNSIFATQSGNSNTLNTEQRGASNFIELTQGGEKNEATMKQFTLVAASSNTAVINQSGNKNIADLLQKEDPLVFPDDSKNKATATQSGTLGTYNLKQGGDEWAPTAEQSLTQSGTKNMAEIKQVGISIVSEINQSGNLNTAELDQLGTQGGRGTAISYSSQTGTSGLIDIDQYYDAGKLVANSVQNGVSNTTDIEQKSNHILNVTAMQLGADIITIDQIGF